MVLGLFMLRRCVKLILLHEMLLFLNCGHSEGPEFYYIKLLCNWSVNGLPAIVEFKTV